jgi:hypothetical protein
MSQTVHNLRLVALVIAIGAGLILEARADAGRVLSEKDRALTESTEQV